MSTNSPIAPEDFIRAMFHLVPQQHVVVRSPRQYSDFLPLRNFQLPDMSRGDWFFGVLPVDKNGQQVGISTCWVDIDHNTQYPPELAMAPPSAAVISGNGLHLYFALDCLTDIDRGMRLVKLATFAFGGDSRVCEPKRVMRIPGSYNMKDPGNPKPCQLVYATWKAYTFDDLESRLIAVALAKYWTPGMGLRHSLALALGALLARAKWNLDKIVDTVDLLSQFTSDIESDDRRLAAQDSALKYEQGIITSYSLIKDQMGIKDFKVFIGLLGILSRDGELILDDEIIGRESTLEQSMTWYTIQRFKDHRFGDGMLYRWEGRYWKACEEKELAHDIFKVLSNVKRISGGEEYELGATNALSNSVMRQFIGYTMGQPMPNQLLGYIPLQNTVIKVPEMDFINHDRDMFNRLIFPITYDENAQCPRWMEYLEEVFPDPTIRIFLQEWAGYCLALGNPYHRMLWIYGPPNSGKSTFLLVMDLMFGDASKALYVDKIDETVVADIANSYIAICAELPNTPLDAGLLNQLTAEDVMQGRFLFCRQFKTKFRGKLMFSSNYLPPIEQGADGLWRRIVIIHTPHVLKRVDPYIMEAFTKELSGIMNWSIEGLRRIVSIQNARRYWTLPESVVKNVSSYHTYADLYDEFIRTNVDFKPDGIIKRQALYTAYRDWCRDNGHAATPYNSNFITEITKRGLTYDAAKFFWIGGELKTIAFSAPGGGPKY